MRKIVLLVTAGILFIVYAYALNEWLRSEHSWHQVWDTATSDWFVAATLFDTLLFALACVIWVASDMKKRSYPAYKIMAMVLACAIAGMPSFLIYLAFRSNYPGEHET